MSRSSDIGGVTPGLIRQHVDRIIRLKAEVSRVQKEIAAEYAAAKSEGLDKKALSELVRRLLADPDALNEQRLTVALYETAYHGALSSGAGH